MARKSTLVLIAIALLLGAGTAAAADFGDRVDHRFDRIGEHREHQFDRRGEIFVRFAAEADDEIAGD